MALEIGLRAYHAHRGTYTLSKDAEWMRRASMWRRSDDPELVYVHRPGFATDGVRHTEASGLLCPEDIPRDKPPGTLRVALLGDSVGAGLAVSFRERFAALLQDSLSRDTGRPVEVLNFCVTGYATLQEARRLETLAGEFEPDAVLVQYCMNDPATSYWPWVWFHDPEPPASYALDFFAGGHRKLTGPGLPVVPKGAADAFWLEQYEPDSPGWQNVLLGLDRIAAWGREHDVPVVLAILPLLLSRDPAGTRTAVQRSRIFGAGIDRGMRVVDLQPVFARRGLSELRKEEGDVYHLSAEGHRVVAEALEFPVAMALDRKVSGR
jgi:lysophospholipase L1-like esterase